MAPPHASQDTRQWFGLFEAQRLDVSDSGAPCTPLHPLPPPVLTDAEYWDIAIQAAVAGGNPAPPSDDEDEYSDEILDSDTEDAVSTYTNAGETASFASFEDEGDGEEAQLHFFDAVYPDGGLLDADIDYPPDAPATPPLPATPPATPLPALLPSPPHTPAPIHIATPIVIYLPPLPFPFFSVPAPLSDPDPDPDPMQAFSDAFGLHFPELDPLLSDLPPIPTYPSSLPATDVAQNPNDAPQPHPDSDSDPDSSLYDSTPLPLRLLESDHRRHRHAARAARRARLSPLSRPSSSSSSPATARTTCGNLRQIAAWLARECVDALVSVSALADGEGGCGGEGERRRRMPGTFPGAGALGEAAAETARASSSKGKERARETGVEEQQQASSSPSWPLAPGVPPAFLSSAVSRGTKRMRDAYDAEPDQEGAQGQDDASAPSGASTSQSIHRPAKVRRMYGALK